MKLHSIALACALSTPLLMTLPANACTGPHCPIVLAQHTPAMAKDHVMAGPVMIMQPWTRVTPNGAKVGGGFMSLTNSGTAADRLVSASSPAAERVEIHEMAMKDGVMIMRQLKDGLPLAAGASVELKPGGYHIMFMDIKAPFKEGDSVKLTLNFEKAGNVELMLPVRGMSGKPAEAHKH